MNVYQKLNAAREAFHSLKLEKTGHNKFAGYYYFELGDFLIPALKVFRDVGLCAVVTFEKEVARMAILSVDEPEPMKVGKFILIESPMGSAALKGCHEVQNIGAVETYQRRYLWVAALEIVEHDALDATTGKERPAKKGSITPTDGAGEGIDPDRLAELDELALYMIESHNAGKDMDAIRIYYDPETFKHTDERVYLWKCLASVSKLRSTIKSNAPTKEAA